MLFRIIFTLVTSISFLILFFLLRYFVRTKLLDFIKKQENKIFKGFYLKKIELINAENQVNIILFILRILYILLNVVIIFITLTIVFYLWPQTKGISDIILKYIWIPFNKIIFSIISFIPNLIIIFIIIFVTHFSLKFLRFIGGHIEKGTIKINGFYPDWVKPTYLILSILFYTFAIILAFPYLPASNTPAFQGISIFIGIVFSLSSTSVLGNIISGIVITYMRSFKIGDRIKVSDITGDVLEKNVFTIKLKTLKNEIILIPNSSMLSYNILNYTKSVKGSYITIYSTVTIGYDVPWKKVHELLISAAMNSTGILKEPIPFVLQTSLDDFYVSYQINAFTNEDKILPKIYSDLHQNIQDEFKNSNIEIMSPHYRAVRDGNQSTVPK